LAVDCHFHLAITLWLGNDSLGMFYTIWLTWACRQCVWADVGNGRAELWPRHKV